MKALRLRKTLWVANTVLIAGVAGLGALYLLQKPAAAGSKDVVTRGKKAFEEYKQKTPVPVLVPPVKEEDITQYIRKPEWKNLPYYPYAGPKIPAPPPPTTEKPVVDEGPKDLEATGRVYMLIYDPPRGGETVASGSILYWEFSGDKKTRLAFVPGEFVAATGAPQKFKLKDVIHERVSADQSRYRILYDVHEKGPNEPATRSAEIRWDTEVPLEGRAKGVLQYPTKPAEPVTPGPEGPGKPAASGPGGTGPGGTGVVQPTPAPAPEPAPAANDWKPEITVDPSGQRNVLWTERTVRRFQGKKADEVMNEVLKNVRTENYDKGGVQGIAVYPAENDEMAQAFDVRRGDVLVSINGQPVKSKDDAIRIAKALPQDTARVTVVIDRLGRLITYNVDPRDPQTRRAAAGLAR